MPYFAESTPPRRWLQAVAVVVAAGAIYLGVASYRGREQERKPVTDLPLVVTTSQPSLPKKSVPKARRTRTSGSEQPAFTAGFAEGAIEPLSMRESVTSDAENGKSDSAPGVIVGSQTHEEAKGTPSLPACEPLPNSTKPEDVDADYYQNWAREYGCKASESPKR